MSSPAVLSLGDVAAAGGTGASVWCSPRFAALARETFGGAVAADLEPRGGAIPQTLIAIGGGSRLDRAKVWRAERSPTTRLIAIPSVWGSGAEASPVAVLTGPDGAKDIRIGASYLPDARAVWPELAASLDEDRARWACGDVWAHAVEGFLSPLATTDLRAELAGIIRELHALRLPNDARWFDPSARAAASQARSSVGLVHGIAHTLERELRALQPDAGWGHARLCATFLLPVLSFNRTGARSSAPSASSPGPGRMRTLFAELDVDEAAVFRAAASLFAQSDYDAALPVLEARWDQVLRDPCTRTNSALVRPAALEYFKRSEFT